MQSLEYFEVECPEKAGGDAYREITNDVLLDHNLLKVFRRLHIFIDPKVPIFVAVGILNRITTVVKVGDFANINPLEGKITLVIADETYLAPMLKIFWERFGSEKVDQPDRFTVVLYGVSATPEEIEKIVVADPSLNLGKDLIYAFRLIAPEGFRVRREIYDDNKYSFVSGENTLGDEIDGLIREKFAMIGEG